MEDKLAMVKFEDVLRQATHKVGVSLSDTQIGLFGLYLRELLEWNKTFNLTSIRDPEDIIIKHFVDSLTPLPYLELSGEILDIGPGAGFPSLPLKIAAPELQVQLVEANRKKVSFLKHLIRTLKLESVTVLHSRFEHMRLPEQFFSTIISRAFTRLEPLLKLVTPFLQPGNTLVVMLGPTNVEDHARFADLALTEGLGLDRTVSLELPRGRGGRTLLFLVKI
ncbi:MAG: 16S rRNA (guanine(527)-N(7))-methyltransferase RsmG [Deltaproteobacteria bacterium]|nr:16S rRNA (guanine(527)-N(7))-methyltransferase RsmG [Deltaproteobacteria bacterium]